MALAPFGTRTWRPFILDACYHAPRATYPDDEAGNSPEGCPSMSSLFGFAPGGVYRAAPVASRAVGSYPTLSPLPQPRPRRFAFCGTIPGVTPAGRYPAPCFHGARTFLTRSLSALAGAAARPAGMRIKSFARQNANENWSLGPKSGIRLSEQSDAHSKCWIVLCASERTHGDLTKLNLSPPGISSLQGAA